MNVRMVDAEVGMTTLRAGIIGCGRIAGSIEDEALDAPGVLALPYSHATAYRDARGVDLVAVADADVEVAKRFADRWSVDAAYGSAEQMLAGAALDVVSICTPTRFHADIFCLAAETPGIRGAFLEKPVGLSLAEAGRMTAAAEAGGVRVAVNHTRTYDPVWRRIKQLVDAGEIGEVRAISSRWVEGWSFGGSHLFDLVRYLIDSHPTRVYCELAGDARDPGGTAHLTYANGVRMQVVMLDDVSGGTEVMLLGTCGRIVVDAFGPRLYVRPSGGMEAERPFPAQMYWTSGMVRAVEELVSAVRDGGAVSSTLADGVAALEIAVALNISGARSVPVDLPVTDDTWTVDAV